MKCPWRTVTTTTTYTKEVSKTSIDFENCLGEECPYYGVPVPQHRYEGGWQTVIELKCRRCEV